MRNKEVLHALQESSLIGIRKMETENNVGQTGDGIADAIEATFSGVSFQSVSQISIRHAGSSGIPPHFSQMYALSSALESKDDKECITALANFCTACASLDDGVKAEIVGCSPRILTTLLRMASGAPRKLPAAPIEEDSSTSSRATNAGTPASPSAPVDPQLADLAVELLASLGEAGPLPCRTILSLPHAVSSLLRYLHNTVTDKGKQRAGALLAQAARLPAVDDLILASLSQCSTTLAGISSSTAARANAVRTIRHLLATAGAARLLLRDALLVELLVDLLGGNGAPSASVSAGASASMSAAFAPCGAVMCSVFADEALQALLAVSRTAADVVAWDASVSHHHSAGSGRAISAGVSNGESNGHVDASTGGGDGDATGAGDGAQAKDHAHPLPPTAGEQDEALQVLALLGSNVDIFPKLVMELGKTCTHSFVAANILQNLCFLETHARTAIRVGAVEALHALMNPRCERVDSLSSSECCSDRLAGEDGALTQAPAGSNAVPPAPRDPLETPASGRQAAAVALSCLLATDSYASSGARPGRGDQDHPHAMLYPAPDYQGDGVLVGDAAVCLVANVRRVMAAMPFQTSARTRELATEAERLVGAAGALVMCDRTGEATLASGLLDLFVGLLKDGRRHLTPRLQLLVSRALLAMAFVPACRRAMIDAGSGAILTKFLDSWVHPSEPQPTSEPSQASTNEPSADTARAQPEAHLASQGALWLLSGRTWAELDTLASAPPGGLPERSALANGALLSRFKHTSSSKASLESGLNPDIGELNTRLLLGLTGPSRDVRSPGTVSLSVSGEGGATPDSDRSQATDWALDKSQANDWGLDKTSNASGLRLSPGEVGKNLLPSPSDTVFLLFNTCQPTVHECRVVRRLHRGMVEAGLRVRCCVAAARDHVAGVPWAYVARDGDAERGAEGGERSPDGQDEAAGGDGGLSQLGGAWECFADNNGLPHLRKVAEVMESCSVICLALSQGAQLSGMCHLQVELAMQLRKIIVPALVQPGYRPYGWVRQLVGGRLIFDLTDSASVGVRGGALVSTVRAACSAGVLEGSALLDPVTHTGSTGTRGGANEDSHHSSTGGSTVRRHAAFDVLGTLAVAACDQQARAVLAAAQLADAGMRVDAVGAGAAARMNALVYSRSNSAQELDARSGQLGGIPPGFDRQPTLSRVKGSSFGGGAGSPRHQMWGMAGYDAGAEQLHPFALPGLPPPPSPSLYSNQSSLEKGLDRRFSWGVCSNCQQRCLREPMQAFCGQCGAKLEGSPADSLNGNVKKQEYAEQRTLDSAYEIFETLAIIIYCYMTGLSGLVG
eukprot:jgi/Mesvir1/23515/Mv18221-RA.1